MASILQEAVASIMLNDYASVVTLAAVGYDYILTFPMEMEYIWNKRWSRVSVLFVLVRYFGLCAAITFSLGSVLVDVASCASDIFLIAAELTMILRVWALYNRSRIILGVLLILYVAEAILALVEWISYTIQLAGSGAVTIVNVAYLSVCIFPPDSPGLILPAYAVQIALGVAMCLLVAIKFTRESLQAYKLTGRVRLNRYTMILAREGTVYFLVILAYALLNVLSNTPVTPPNGWIMLCGIMEYVIPYTLVPRFILNLRELYARDLRGSDGSGMDTAFGLGSASGHGHAVSAIMFADAGQNGVEEQTEEQGEEIQLEGRAGGGFMMTDAFA